MTPRIVPDFNSSVLLHLKRLGEGTLVVDGAQLDELPDDMGKSVRKQIEETANASTMTRLTGKSMLPSASSVDMGRLLGYFSTAAADAESILDGNRLDYPLSNYFVNTSHNTYLTGNQLYGSASTQAYKDVLRRGCRSIEIDVWDGKSADSEKLDDGQVGNGSKQPSSPPEPRVLHGYTLTKEVSFREVCRAIGEAAFQTSDLPVIVSLEVHARAAQQQMMVDIMHEAWQHQLVPSPDQECQMLPSPDQLRGKILVKVKGTAIGKPEDTLNVLTKTSTRESRSGSEEESSSDEASRSSTPTPQASKKVKKSKIIEALSALGIYTRAYHFKNFHVPEASLATHVFSLSERKVMTVSEEDDESLLRHNRSFLMRVFPSGSRVTSSNLDPPVYWRKGVQMVALNWQKVDASIMLNHAMFAGSAGWVLKPNGYRNALGPPTAASAQHSETFNDDLKRYTASFTVEVMAAQKLPPAKHPYVKCELHAETPQQRKHQKVEGDGRSKDSEHKRRTKVSKTLDFHGESLQFVNIPDVVPALSFVRFKVMDDVLGPDELVAWACIRLDRLKTGLRFLHLIDPQGNEIDGVLLINTSKSLS